MGIRTQDFERMIRRAARPRESMPSAPPAPAASGHEVMLGVDPSLRGTGYGVIRRHGSGWRPAGLGVIQCPKAWEVSRCLARIHEQLSEVILEHQPTVCAMEGEAPAPLSGPFSINTYRKSHIKVALSTFGGVAAPVMASCESEAEYISQLNKRLVVFSYFFIFRHRFL